MTKWEEGEEEARGGGGVVLKTESKKMMPAVLPEPPLRARAAETGLTPHARPSRQAGSVVV